MKLVRPEPEPEAAQPHQEPVDGLAVLLAEVIHGVLLGGCALTHELAGLAGQALRGHAVPGGVVLAGIVAGDESEGAGGDDAERSDGTLKVANHRNSAFPVQVHFRWKSEQLPRPWSG